MEPEAKLHDHIEIVEVRSSTPIWKHILWAVVAVLFLWALAQIPNTIIVFSLAWLISYLLNPVIDALQGRRIGPIKKCSRGMAVAIVTGLLVGVVVAAGAWAVPHLTEQVQKLISLQDSISDPSQLPITLREKAEPFLAKIPEAYRDEAMEKASEMIQDSASKIGVWVSKGIGWLGSFLGELLSGIFLVCTAFLVALYMLMNWYGMAEAFLEKLPKQYRDEVQSLSEKMDEIFGAYLKATILTSLACMVATFVSLLLLSSITGHEFPYKGLVSFVAGIAYPVPVIGIIATSILGGVLGYLPENNLGFAISVLVMINVVNAIIDRTVQPKLMSDAIGVSELFVMFAAFAGGEIAGIWGMLLGIPVAAMGKALFEWFHVNFLVVEELTPEERRHVQGPDAPPEADTPPEPAEDESKKTMAAPEPKKTKKPKKKKAKRKKKKDSKPKKKSEES
jgi:predicted PurR-regulated permease PerM